MKATRKATASCAPSPLRSPERRARRTAVGRLGGDEFGVLLIEAGPETAGSFLSRLHERLPESVSASAGAAFLPADAAEPTGLIQAADRRLYADKRARANAA